MEHAKKMILIDPRVLESLKSDTQPVKDATMESLKDMDHHMKQIMDRADLDLNDKASAYQQALRRFLNRAEDYKQKPLGSISIAPIQPDETQKEAKQNDAVESNVIESVPITLKRKAKLLLDHIKSNSDLTWNPKGEILYQGKVIEKSNLVDLINDVMRKRKTSKQPVGWEQFAWALRDTNTPQEYIGNKDRWNYIQRYTTPEAKADPPFFSSYEDTPRKLNRKSKRRQSLSPFFSSFEETPTKTSRKRKQHQSPLRQWTTWDDNAQTAWDDAL